MLKRRFASRSDWKRIIKRQYVQTHVVNDEFNGTITLLHLVEVSEPLWVQYTGKRICIVDNGYMWMQHFPHSKNFALTTMFDADGEVVQWYIDISSAIGIENNDPWWDDLFLDIVVFPDGEYALLDEDELQEALANGDIDQAMNDFALNEANRIITSIKEGKFPLFQYATKHKELLIELLKKGE